MKRVYRSDQPCLRAGSYLLVGLIGTSQRILSHQDDTLIQLSRGSVFPRTSQTQQQAYWLLLDEVLTGIRLEKFLRRLDESTFEIDAQGYIHRVKGFRRLHRRKPIHTDKQFSC